MQVSSNPPMQLVAPPMTPFPLTMQIGMKRFYGHIFLGAGRLYFVCGRKGGAWGAAIGQSLGGLVGAAIVAAATPGAGAAPSNIVDEATVMQAISANEGSMILEAKDISMIKHTIWWRLIKWHGKTVGLPQGMSKDLRAAIGQWAKYHNVPHKGVG